MSGNEHHPGCMRRVPGPRQGTRTALHLRVSKAEQKPDLQQVGLQAYAGRAGLDVVQSYYDVAVSDRKEGRPQFNAFMTGARSYDFNYVLEWEFGHFARSTRHLLTPLDKLKYLGVRFVSVQEQVNTSSPMGQAMFTIISAMAELESTLISEHVTAGMRAASSSAPRGRGAW